MLAALYLAKHLLPGELRDEGRRWLEQAAQGGNADAQAQLGVALMLGNHGYSADLDRAKQWLQRAAAQDRPALRALIDNMDQIKGGAAAPVPADELAAAERGDIALQVTVGLRYQLQAMQGEAQAWPQAWRWFERAAAAGSLSAQHRLGELHRDGLGTTPDAKAALRWFRKAAEGGFAEAQLGNSHRP